MLSTLLLNTCIAAFCKCRHLAKAEAVIVDGIRLGVLPDVVTYNTLVDAYCRIVGLDEGYSILQRMREAGITPDVVTYNAYHLEFWIFLMKCFKQGFLRTYGATIL